MTLVKKGDGKVIGISDRPPNAELMWYRCAICHRAMLPGPRESLTCCGQKMTVAPR